MDGSKLIAGMTGLSILSLESQHNRLLRLDFPRRDAPAYVTLLVNSIKATEELSRDFEFRVDLISDSATIDPASMMAKMVTISMVRSDGSLRYFNGYVTEFQLIRADGGLAYYQMLLEPWLAFTRLREDCYSFQNRSVIELTEDTFVDYMERDWRTRIRGQMPTLTCANQYNESDHNHLHRRWEAAGLFYWYEHRADGHTLWLSDDSRMAPKIDAASDTPGEIRFHAAGGSGEDDSIHEWSTVRRIKPGLTTLASFDYKCPGAQTVSQKSVNRQGNVFAREVYLNTGYGFGTTDAGQTLAERKMQTINANSLLYKARGDNRNVLPGRYFKLKDHFSSDLCNLPRGGESEAPPETFEYLIVKVVHSASNNYQVGRNAPSHYDNEMTCVSTSNFWRPGTDHNSRKHPNPGILTATVVGPEGEDIHTDDLGRVRVQFHWDRVGKFDVNSSQWIRVMTGWAGVNFGQIFLPRIGQEVVVQFVGGNVDNPIIIGSVYNSNNMPPWELPANKTQSGILTRSTKDGMSVNANALRFEDRKGREQLWLHAEKDQLVEVEHDEDKWVGNDRRKTIDHDETTLIKHNRTETVGNDETITVQRNRNERVDHEEHISIGDGRTVEVGKNERESIGGNCQISVNGLKTETVKLAKALSVGLGYQVSVGGAMNTTVGMTQMAEILGGKMTKVGRTYSIDAGDSFSINVGSASLSMNKDGVISISGSKIIVDAGGKVFIDGSHVLINSGGDAAPHAPRGDSNAEQATTTPAPASTESGAVTTGLGPEVDALAAKSPSLQKDLIALKEQGVQIEYGPPGEGTRFARNGTPPTIIIDANEQKNPADAVGMLAHEVGHARNPYVPSYLSKNAYVNGTLADEATAQMSAIKVQREIVSNGGPEVIIGGSKNAAYYNGIYDQYLRDGNKKAAIHAIAERYKVGEQISGLINGVHPTYGEYYSRAFDDHEAEADSGT